MAAAGEDSIGEREGGRGLKRRQMRARARGREPSSNWARRSHVPGYIWRARVWGSSRFLAKFRSSSDRIRREPPMRRRLAGSARLRRRRAGGGDATPRRAVSSSLLGLGWSPSRVRFGCICPCSPAWPFCFSWPIGRDRLRRRPCDAEQRWIPIRRLPVQATGRRGPAGLSPRFSFLNASRSKFLFEKERKEMEKDLR